MDCFLYPKSKEGAIILSVFSEVKEHLTARQVAEHYGLQVKRNGMAVLPVVSAEMRLIMFLVCLNCHSMMRH